MNLDMVAVVRRGLQMMLMMMMIMHTALCRVLRQAALNSVLQTGRGKQGNPQDHRHQQPQTINSGLSSCMP